MGTKSRETIYGASVRAAAERATEARKEADRLACEAWNKRMLGFQGPAQPSLTLGDALNAGYRYLEVKCLGCNTHQTVALEIVRRPKATPVHELERYMRCRQCSIQAQPSGRAASDEDLSQRSAINVVAGGALEIMAEETKPSWVKTLGATLSLVLAAFYLFWLLPKIAANPQEAGPLGNFFFVLIYAQLWMITWGYAMRAAVTFYGLPKPRFFIRFKFDIRKSTRGWTVVALMFLSYALTVYGFGIAYIYLSAFY